MKNQKYFVKLKVLKKSYSYLIYFITKRFNLYLDGRRFHLNIKKVHTWMQESWKVVAAMELNKESLQKALLVLHDNLLPHLPQSVLLTDFLMNAMDHCQ